MFCLVMINWGEANRNTIVNVCSGNLLLPRICVQGTRRLVHITQCVPLSTPVGQAPNYPAKILEMVAQVGDRLN